MISNRKTSANAARSRWGGHADARGPMASTDAFPIRRRGDVPAKNIVRMRSIRRPHDAVDAVKAAGWSISGRAGAVHRFARRIRVRQAAAGHRRHLPRRPTGDAGSVRPITSFPPSQRADPRRDRDARTGARPMFRRHANASMMGDRVMLTDAKAARATSRKRRRRRTADHVVDAVAMS